MKPKCTDSRHYSVYKSAAFTKAFVSLLFAKKKEIASKST